MEVSAFKMVSGEEVIARLNGTVESLPGVVTHYRVEKPMTLMVGGGGMGLIPWALSNPDAEVNLPETSVIVMFKPSETIMKAYLEQTSKIALA